MIRQHAAVGGVGLRLRFRPRLGLLADGELKRKAAARWEVVRSVNNVFGRGAWARPLTQKRHATGPPLSLTLTLQPSPFILILTVFPWLPLHRLSPTPFGGRGHECEHDAGIHGTRMNFTA